MTTIRNVARAADVTAARVSHVIHETHLATPCAAEITRRTVRAPFAQIDCTIRCNSDPAAHVNSEEGL
jgi:DNA-binding LacI/PurR family transcriptional regulator